MELNVIRVLFSTVVFLYTFHVLYSFMYFTSVHNQHEKNPAGTVPDEDLLTTIWKLTVDTALLSIFMFQHSFMSRKVVKGIYEKIKAPELDRSIFNAFSAAALHLMIKNWQFTPSMALWHVNTSSSNKLWLLFTSFHSLGWFIIYSGCVMLDISELVGLKQVYYRMSKRPCPMATKSSEYQRYLSHMRHPSFTGFLIIIWLHPVMTLDRLLMSSIFTIYMLLMWDIDTNDYCYHTTNVNRKRQELL